MKSEPRRGTGAVSQTFNAASLKQVKTRQPVSNQDWFGSRGVGEYLKNKGTNSIKYYLLAEE